MLEHEHTSSSNIIFIARLISIQNLPYSSHAQFCDLQYGMETWKRGYPTLHQFIVSDLLYAI